MKHWSVHRLIIYCFAFLIPINLRVIYFPEKAYIGNYFSYHLSFILYLTDLLIIAGIAAWLIIDKPTFSGRFYQYSIVFILIAALSMFHVKRVDLAIHSLIKWVELFLISAYISNQIRDISQTRKLFFAIYLSSILQAVIGLFQFFKQSSLGLSWLGEYIAPIGTPGVATIDFHSLKILRAYGTLPHPNILGAFLVFGLFIGLYYVSRETFVKKLLVSCGTTVILLGIIASFSRSAWLIAIFGLVSFTLYNLYRKNLSAVPVIVLILLVSCGTFFITSGKLVKSRVSELNASSTSITLREGFNRMSFDLIKTSPILGVGIGNYIPNLQSAYSLQPWQYQPPHNIFLFILAETGILGLFSFCLMLYFVISSTWNFKKDILTFGLLGIFVGFLALGMFDHYLVTIQQGQLMFFTLIGIILAQQNNSITYAPTQKNNS